MDWIPEGWIPVVAGIVPSIGVGLLFWFVMRAVLRADRNERAALAHKNEGTEESAGSEKYGGTDPADDVDSK